MSPLPVAQFPASGAMRRPGASGRALKGLPTSPGSAVHTQGLKARLPRVAGTQSALLRQKGLADKKLGVERGDLKKAKGATKGAAGKELSQAKKAAAPAHKVVAKDAAGLKSAAGIKKKAAVKSMAPTHSALLRHQKAAGKQLTGRKSTMTKEIGGVKKAAHAGTTASVTKAGSSMKKVQSSVHKTPTPAKKLGALTQNASPKGRRPPKFGGLFRGRSSKIR